MKNSFYVVTAILVLMLSGNVSARPSVPTADTEDWVYRKNKKTGKSEKFFAIGTWHVPGIYNPVQSPGPVNDVDKQLFRQKTADFNVVNIDPRYIQSYMSEKILMVNNFVPSLYAYIDKVPELPANPRERDYARTQFMKANANNPQLVAALDDAVRQVKEKYGDFERVYNSIDEIALGGGAKWFVPSVIGKKIYERVKLQEPNPIVFVDLVGHGRGSTFFFEQNYLKTHSSMPTTPPYELLDPQAGMQTELPFLGFIEAHDGTPVYNFDAVGKYSYNDIPFENFRSMWYENIRQIAAAYQDNGNVFAINAFRDFNAYPVLAGVTIDALKSGLGDKPVWLYFDGNAYAKPKSVSYDDYVNMVKCQIYTSLVHGATGFLFWNEWRNPPDGFDAMLPVVKELNENQPIFKLKTIKRFASGDLHWMMKQDDSNKRYIIMTNTSKTSKQTVKIPSVSKKELAALEVYVAAL